MKKWTTLGEATTPDGKKIAFRERDGLYVIFVDGAELMSNRKVTSEWQLGELACTPLKGTPRPKVMVGGLGMGFTLRAVLATLAADAAVTVVELMKEIIVWNQNPEYPLAAEPLADQRVELVNDDVFNVIQRSEGVFNAILLDVDNGPAALTLASNDRLYGDTGLNLIHRALRPRGRVAVWSVNDDPVFTRSLTNHGFHAEVHRSTAHGSSGHRTVFIGTRD